MSATIRFTVTDHEAELISRDAAAHGLTRSQYAKTALFAHINKYSGRGVFAALYSIVRVDGSLVTFHPLGDVQPTFLGPDGRLQRPTGCNRH